jgi:hypothetical protein
MNGHAHSATERYRLAPAPSAKPSQWLAPQDRPMTAVVLPITTVANERSSSNLALWQWTAVAAAALITISLSGVIGWLTIGRRTTVDTPPMANRSVVVEQTPQDQLEAPKPSPPQVPEETPVHPTPLPRPFAAETPEVPAETHVKIPNEVPSEALIAPQSEPLLHKSTPPAPRPPEPSPSRRKPLPQPPELAIHSPQGVLLVNAGKGSAWRVAGQHHLLQGPARFLSLAESWTTAEIPDLGTLICEGSTEIGLSQLIDGVMEIRLERGHVAIQALAEGTEVRVLTGPAVWTARGLADDSTLAVMFDPLSPGIAVPRGLVALDDTPVGTRQILRWQNGALSPYDPVQPANPSGATAAIAGPIVNPWDLDWLIPPDEARHKQWQSVYGRLVDRLAEANDFEAELERMLATSRDNRHMVLLAHWSATSEPPATRARRVWNMLGERRLAVRIAGLTCLLDLPPGDLRREELLTLLENATDQTTRGQVTAWLDSTRQAAPLSQEHAAELSNCLTHEELAVRQIAVSLLELHATTALLQAGLRSPPYDAAGPSPNRAAAQQQWRALLRKLLTPAADNTGRSALGPASLKPIP